MPSPPTRHRFATGSPNIGALAASTPALVAVTGVFGAFLGIVLVAKPNLVLELLALGFAVGGIAVVYTRPAVAFAGLVLLLGLIPTYAAPSLSSILLIPAAAAGWGIAAALMWRNAVDSGVLFKPNAIDLAVGAFVALMAVSLGFSARTETKEFVHLMFMWIGPYLGARLLLREVDKPAQLVAISFAIVTVILAPIALVEYLGGSNPFFNLNFNSTEFSVWASQVSRFGEIRATTSFGHPIAFSMFLACSALLSTAQAVNTSARRPRRLWYAAAGIAVGTMALALSRNGWLMLGVGLVLLLLAAVRGPARSRLLGLFGVVLCVMLAIGILLPSALQGVPGLGHSEESNYRSSGLYREALLERALQPGVLGLWGNPVNKVTPAVNFGSATDNEYIILADAWGLIPTFALFGVAASLLYGVVRLRNVRGDPAAVLPIVAFTCLVAIFFVAFITQQQVMIWLLVGAAAAAYEQFGRRTAGAASLNASEAGDRTAGSSRSEPGFSPSS